MDNEKIRTLQILEQIEIDESVSQRALASNLNVSLGLVNLFIKRLVKKGYIKVRTIPRNRIAYLLTPKGATEKAALTYKYVRYSFSFYKRTRESLFQMFDKLYDEGIQKIAFYGVSEMTEIAYVTIQQTSLKLVGVFENKEVKFLGEKVNNIKNIEKKSFDKIIITELEISAESKLFLENLIDKSKLIYIRKKI